MKELSKALLLALISRVLVIAVAIIANMLFGVSTAQVASHEANPVPIASLFNRFDSGYYLGIAYHGYPTGYPDISFWTEGGHYINANIVNPVLANPDWAFFPLYPALIKAVSFLFIFLQPESSLELAGFVISNVCFFFAAYFFFKLTNKLFGSLKLALLATTFFSFFGGAVFYSAIYTESLFMTLALAAFYYLEENKLPTAVVLGFLAAFTKSDGFIVAIPFIFYALQSIKNKRESIRLLGSSILVASPFLIFQGVGYVFAGQVFPVTLIAHNLNFAVYPVLTEQIIRVSSWKLLPVYLAGLLLIFLPLIYSTIRLYTKSINFKVLWESRQLKYWSLYVAAVLIVIFISSIDSIIRYSVIMLPMYWVSALTYRRKRWAGIIIFLVMSALLVVGTIMLETGSNFM